MVVAIALAVSIVLAGLGVACLIVYLNSAYEEDVTDFDEWQKHEAKEALRQRNMRYRHGFLGYILWRSLDDRKKRKKKP